MVIRRYLAPGLGRRVGVVVAVVSIVAQIIVLGAAGWALANRAAVRDWVIVGKAVPTATIEGYVSAAGLSSAGRFYLLAARPELHTAATFGKSCTAKEKGIAVLGCYIIATDRIHLLDITDPAFDTMEPVVAAHEMLHAVWARFDDAERARVGEAVRRSYAALGDPALAERLRVYAGEIGDIGVAALFAVLGTELALVDTELDAVYNRYFDRRGAVVALAAEAATVISTIVDEISRVSAELVRLEAEIAAATEKYHQGVDDLAADVATFNSNANTPGYYQSQSKFDRDRAALKKREAALEADRLAINANVDEFNTLVGQLEVLNGQAMALNEALGVDVSVITPVTPPDVSP